MCLHIQLAHVHTYECVLEFLLKKKKQQTTNNPFFIVGNEELKKKIMFTYLCLDVLVYTYIGM